MTLSTDLTCTIPATILREAPFNLLWGDNIIAKVVAINSYGNSDESQQGSGAVIITKPGAPTSLSEDSSLRTAASIKLNWIEPTIVGGTKILDYKVTLNTFTVYEGI